MFVKSFGNIKLSFFKKLFLLSFLIFPLFSYGGWGWALMNFAIKRNDLKEAQLIVRKQRSVLNILDEYGQTLLHSASWYGRLEIAKLFLDEGAKSVQDQWGLLPIHYAVYKGDADMVKLFIKQGTEIHIEDNRGRTPRDYAKKYNHPEIIDILDKAEREKGTCRSSFN